MPALACLDPTGVALCQLAAILAHSGGVQLDRAEESGCATGAARGDSPPRGGLRRLRAREGGRAARRDRVALPARLAGALHGRAAAVPVPPYRAVAPDPACARRGDR